MEQPDNDASNPDNDLANLVRDRTELVDRLRDVVRSRLRQLQRVVSEQRMVHDTLISPSGSTEAASPSTAPQSHPDENTTTNSQITSLDSQKDVAEEQKVTDKNATTKITICDFPNEIMYKILKYLPFDMIGENRIVCRHFNIICSDLLNSEFKCLRNVIQQRLHSLKSQMPRRESARRQHQLAREFDIIETVNMRLSLMQTMFSKHIDRSHCSFFAGQVLDEVHRILFYLKTTPVINFAYKVTDELFDLSTMAVEYFKERIEPTLPDISYISGFNDCFLFDSGSSSSGSVNGLDAPGCSKSFENIPDYCSPSSDYSSMVSLKTTDFSELTKSSLHNNTQEVDPDIARSRRPVSVSLTRSATRRIKKLELRNKKANRTIKFLKSSMKTCKRKLVANQKQIRQYHSHFEDYEKKLDATCVKLNSVLEELTKCKTEIQYLRSTNSPSQGTPSQGPSTNLEATGLLTPESTSIVATKTSLQVDDKSKAVKRKLDFVESEMSHESLDIVSSESAHDNFE